MAEPHEPQRGERTGSQPSLHCLVIDLEQVAHGNLLSVVDQDVDGAEVLDGGSHTPLDVRELLDVP